MKARITLLKSAVVASILWDANGNYQTEEQENLGAQTSLVGIMTKSVDDGVPSVILETESRTYSIPQSIVTVKRA